MNKPTNPKDILGIRKAPMSTVPAAVLAELGVAMLEGAAKYGRMNFRAVGVRASVYYDATMRHIMHWWEGEDIDPDSGISHVTKAIASLTVLRDAMLQGKLTDDRPPISAPFAARLNDMSGAILDRHADKNPVHYTRDNCSAAQGAADEHVAATFGVVPGLDYASFKRYWDGLIEGDRGGLLPAPADRASREADAEGAATTPATPKPWYPPHLDVEWVEHDGKGVPEIGGRSFIFLVRKEREKESYSHTSYDDVSPVFWMWGASPSALDVVAYAIVPPGFVGANYP